VAEERAGQAAKQRWISTTTDEESASMATSNRDRVGRGFELLAEGLEPFVDRHMSAAAGSGTDWAQLLEARDKGRPGASKSFDKRDPAALLRVITEEWRVFKDSLSRVEQSFASELRDTRNRWAHNAAFSADDTYRALDTMERLLTAAGAAAQAEEVRRQRTDHQRAVFEAETRRIVKQQEAGVVVAGQGLKPWREVLAPHDDVATGNFSASEFAADLHMVAQGEGGQEYVDPVQFFRRTFLTDGLRELLDRAVRRVGGDTNASPIINLQTNFGGGKTHSLLALWHLLSGTPVSSLPQEVQDLVAGRPLPPQVRRVALVGTHLSPTGASEKPDGTKVSTLWGELAWQLGGRAAYDVVAAADASATNPGEALRELIAAHAPCLILIDEWVAYARQLWGREDLPAGTFDTQFTFAQSLTEVVKAVPGALLVISIPASHDPDRDGESGGSALEVGGPNGQEALQRLQNVVRRVADQWRPANSEESFEIVRRRLFQEPTAEALADIAAVARQFSQFYARHTGEFPREVIDPAYEQRIRAAYPIHPELFDRLYKDWSTLERFQRTRGVLRLMSSVVHALWIAQDAGPVILPGTVPLDVPTVTSEITQYLPDSWKPIIDSDIDGLGSSPVKIDTERPTLGARAITRRLARSIFIGSAPTLRSAHRGIERQRAWLGVAIPGDTIGNFGSAIDLLSQRATYLYAEGSRYWYDTQASVTRTAADYADGLRDQPEEVWAEIVRRLRRSEQRVRSGFAGVHVAPDSTADVSDTEDVRLVILHPSRPHSRGSEHSAAMQFAQEAFERRGSGQRTNRNMVVFLAPDAKRLEELAEATRDYIAWDWISRRVEELNLSPQQVKQVEANRSRSDEAVTARIGQTYHWALVPDQPDPARPPVITAEKADGAGGVLADRVSDKLTRAGLLAGAIAARSIRLDLEQRLASVWNRGHISVGELWAYYCRYPYLTRLRDRSVLEDGVRSTLTSFTWELDGFALAEGYDEASGRYEGLVLPGANAHFGRLTDATLLVAPAVGTAQASAAAPAAADYPAEAGAPSGSSTETLGTDDSTEGVGAVRKPSNTRFFGVCKVDPDRYGRDLTRLSQEILQQLAAVDGAELEVTVEVHARKEDGFPDDKVRIVMENARTLKFQQFGFEGD
jgi:predicted AAA+ superfamily ATPase